MYTKSSAADATVALYLPKAQKDANGYYTAEFNNTFYASNFPCQTQNLTSSAATTCCLLSFKAQYNVLSTFGNKMPDTCNPIQPFLFSSRSFSDAVLGATGAFPDLNNSEVIVLPTGSNVNATYARIRLDHNDVRNYASKFSGNIGGDETMELFVGLAEFAQPSSTSTILDSSTSQIKVTLSKTDYWIATTYASASNTFLNYIKVRVYEVHDATTASGTSQYAMITFAVNSGYVANTNTGLIPNASIRVGFTTSSSPSTVTYVHTCSNITIPSDYNTRLQQECSAKPTICTANTQIVSGQLGFVSVNVPLLTADLATVFTSRDSFHPTIYVEMLVSVVETTTSLPYTTMLSTVIPVTDGGVNSYCDQTAASTSLSDIIETIDVKIGVAGSEADFNKLVTIHPLNSSANHALATQSIESGLLTMAIRGKDSYFTLPGNLGHSLEIEDAFTLHIFGIDKITAVQGVLGQDFGHSAASVVFDSSLGHAKLEPNASLLGSMCTTSQVGELPQQECVLRWDIRNNIETSTAFEITASSDASSWMKNVLGASTHAQDTGASFAKLIKENYGLSEKPKHRKAFWINPSMDWRVSASQSRFALAEKIVLVALISVKEGTGTRRRLLVQSQSSGATATLGISLSTPSTSESVYAAGLGESSSMASTWNIQYHLTDQQACMQTQDMINEIENIFKTFLSDPAVASPVAGVGIKKVTVVLGPGVTCNGRRSDSTVRSQAGSTSTGTFLTVIVFQEVQTAQTGNQAQAVIQRPFLDMAAFSSKPGVLEIIGVKVDPSIKSIPKAASPSAPVLAIDKKSSNSSDIQAGPVAMGVIGGVLFVAAGIAAWRFKTMRSKAKRDDSWTPSATPASDQMQEIVCSASLVMVHKTVDESGQKESVDEALTRMIPSQDEVPSSILVDKSWRLNRRNSLSNSQPNLARRASIS